MNDERLETELERRLAAWMAGAAPHPSPGFADRALRLTATTPQRASWTGMFTIASALGAVAAVALAVVIGLQFGRITPGPNIPTGAVPTVTPGPSLTPTPSEAPPTPSASSSAARDFYRCENATDGYALDVPSDWYANPHVEAGEGLDDVAACRFFGPTEFEIAPNAGLPDGVAISIQLSPEAPPAAGTVISSTDTTVAGRDATVREVETTSEGPTPPGTHVYEYVVSLADGRFLHASTDSLDETEFAERRRILDAMMETLEISS
ncbi:MAG TPA: hypothetical protein VF364_04275 [Candidatus Limnocylindria bacterium]